jgi:hypothetical protein
MCLELRGLSLLVTRMAVLLWPDPGPMVRRGLRPYAGPCTGCHARKPRLKTSGAGGEVATRHVSLEGLTMRIKTAVLWFLLLVPLLLLGGQVLADKRPGKHTHAPKAPHGTTAGDHGHHHQHDMWETPPLSMRLPGAPAGTIRRRSPAESRFFRPTVWSATAQTARGPARQPRACHMPQPTSLTTFTGHPVTGMRTSSGG